MTRRVTVGYQTAFLDGHVLAKMPARRCLLRRERSEHFGIFACGLSSNAAFINNFTQRVTGCRRLTRGHGRDKPKPKEGLLEGDKCMTIEGKKPMTTMRETVIFNLLIGQ